MKTSELKFTAVRCGFYKHNDTLLLYGCETWSLTLREEHRLSVFENRVLRRIFGPKRDGVTGEWRKLHNEELNLLATVFFFQILAHPVFKM